MTENIAREIAGRISVRYLSVGTTKELLLRDDISNALLRLSRDCSYSQESMAGLRLENETLKGKLFKLESITAKPWDR